MGREVALCRVLGLFLTLDRAWYTCLSVKSGESRTLTLKGPRALRQQFTHRAQSAPY
jgi:hypothetical protein